MARSKDNLAYDPANLRHAVEIQALQATGNTDVAGPEMAWATILSTHAEIKPLRAEDVIRSGQTISEVEIPIRIRYQPGIAANMRVVRVSTGDTYLIRGILNMQERGRWLILMCIALGANE